MPDAPATPSPEGDPTVQALARLFREHPAWVRAARHLGERAESAVYFGHLPGRPFRLVRRGGRTRLEPGRAHDPDLAFRFSPEAVARLGAVEGDDVGVFAVALFSLMLETRGPDRVGFRVVAPFARLARRGYVRLLLAAGPTIVAFGIAHGVPSLRELRRLVARMRREGPAEWELADGAPKR